MYYDFTVGSSVEEPATWLMFYGGSGCPSWKAVMPGYVDGLGVNARVLVLNKRHVGDTSTGMFGCGDAFHAANNPQQWVADYTAFIDAQLAAAPSRPKRLVLVGVSEGALPAVQIAARHAAVTHLVIIGDGAFTMRQSLSILKERGAFPFDPSQAWREIQTDPSSLEQTWMGNPYRWWTDVMDLDPLPDMLALKVPVLVGMGEADQSVPVESVRHWQATYAAAGKTNLQVRVYKGADHRLNAKGANCRSDFLAAVGQWLNGDGGAHAATPDKGQACALVESKNEL
ncbi:hypothetical protein NBRC116584_30250 [Hydrogenophaga sp. 5NK40-0174]